MKPSRYSSILVAFRTWDNHQQHRLGYRAAPAHQRVRGILGETHEAVVVGPLLAVRGPFPLEISVIHISEVDLGGVRDNRAIIAVKFGRRHRDGSGCPVGFLMVIGGEIAR